MQCSVLQLYKRPFPPDRSLRENIQEDVRIHQGHELIPASDRHDLLGGKTWASDADQLREAAGLSGTIGFFDHDATVRGAPKHDLAAWNDSEVIADRLGDRYLALACHCCCHGDLQR